MTEGYECGYEEVRCEPWKEWLSDTGRFGFVGAFRRAPVHRACAASPALQQNWNVNTILGWPAA